MKKLFFAAIAVLSLSLVSCGGKKEAKADTDGTELNGGNKSEVPTFDFKAAGLELTADQQAAFMEQIQATGSVDLEELGVDIDNLTDEQMEAMEKAYNQYMGAKKQYEDAMKAAQEAAEKAAEAADVDLDDAMEMAKQMTGDVDLDEAMEMAKQMAGNVDLDEAMEMAKQMGANVDLDEAMEMAQKAAAAYGAFGDDDDDDEDEDW